MGDVLASLCADECECWEWDVEIELCLTVLPICLLPIFAYDLFWRVLLDALCLFFDEIVLFLDWER